MSAAVMVRFAISAHVIELSVIFIEATELLASSLLVILFAAISTAVIELSIILVEPTVLSASVELMETLLVPSKLVVQVIFHTNDILLAVASFVAVPAFPLMLHVISEVNVFIPAIVWFHIIFIKSQSLKLLKSDEFLAIKVSEI
jgi:hypothetical protein